MGKKNDVKPFDKLSERQQNILRFMFDYMEDNGFPPTIREIGEATDINSTSVVNYNLNKLVTAGYLDRSDRVSRGLRIIAAVPGKGLPRSKMVRMSVEIKRVPLIGKIAAGTPLEVPEDIGHSVDEDSYVDVTPTWLGGVDVAETYALKVEGDSMIDAMIDDGDIVILRHTNTASNGDMVAAWLPQNGETTLKYFYKEGNKVRLKPAHPTMEDIVVDAKNCEIHGTVLSVIRRLH
jgi:repressor LexA